MSVESLFSELKCTECSRTFPIGLNGTCECGAPLVAQYEGFAPRPVSDGLWSWRSLLPPCTPVSLGEPSTPLVSFGGAYIKDEGGLPTKTFKARGAAVGVSMARELGAEGVVIPSAGNAGAAWAAYCAEARLPCAVFLPRDLPDAALMLVRDAGAEVHLLDDGIDQAARDAMSFANARGWHYAATFREPWRVEGKKTALFEISRDLGWKIPSAVVLPVGGGVGAIAFHLAAQQVRRFGWADGSMRVYAVQAEGCAPVVRAISAAAEVPEPWSDPRTAAAGIRIPRPLAGRLLLRVLRESEGGAVAVSESDMEQAREEAVRATGVIFCLEAAAAIAAYLTLQKRGAFGPDEVVVIYGTGSS